MSRVTGLAVFLALALTLAGCGDPKHPASLQGTWSLTDFRPRGAAAQSPQWATFHARILQRLAKNPSTMTLNAKGDMATAVGANGKWEVKGEQLTLSTGGTPAVQPAAAPIAPVGAQRQQFTFKLEAGGKTLRMSQNGSEMVWTKQ